TSEAMSIQLPPPGAFEPFIFHLGHRQQLERTLPSAPLRRCVPGTGEGALAGMIIVTLCLVSLVLGGIHVGRQAPYIWPTAILFAALDGWFLCVIVRLDRSEGRAKRLFETGQTLHGSVVRCTGFDQFSAPSSWEATGEYIYSIALEYSFRTP